MINKLAVFTVDAEEYGMRCLTTFAIPQEDWTNFCTFCHKRLLATDASVREALEHWIESFN